MTAANGDTLTADVVGRAMPTGTPGVLAIVEVAPHRSVRRRPRARYCQSGNVSPPGRPASLPLVLEWACAWPWACWTAYRSI